MPSGNVVFSDKMQFFGAGAGGGGGEIHHHRQWFPDERDGLISWFCGEFAAANAIIDSLCHHLQCIGEPGDYDAVFGCIQQRRCNWHPVLHMQSYQWTAEITHALQQVTWRKQKKQQQHLDQSNGAEKGFRKWASYRQSHRVESVRENNKSSFASHSRFTNSLASLSLSDVNLEKGVEKEEEEGEAKQRNEVQISEDTDSMLNEGIDGIANSQEECKPMHGQDPVSIEGGNSESETNDGSDAQSKGSYKNAVPKNADDAILNQDEKQKLVPIPKTFTGVEVFDGKAVNVVEGLKLYEGLFESSEIARLVSMANEMRAAGRRGEFQGQTYVSLKRPMKGHGREMLQLGLPVVDGPPDDGHAAGSSKERMVEAIPKELQEVIDDFIRMQVMTLKPDSCIIDFFNDGDHSHAHACPPWYGRPFCILSLTECDVVFGRVIGIDHPGDYRGSLKLSLAAGSLLVMQGKCADFAKHAISSLCKQRILVTFTKSCPRKRPPTDASRFTPSMPASAAQASLWGSLLSRNTNLPRHPSGSKNYAVVPTTGVLSSPPIRPHQLPLPNGLQPVFVTPIAQAVPYPTPVPLPPVSTAWTAVPARHSAVRLPAPGTGVFIPPSGSGLSAPSPQLLAETNVSMEDSSLVENENAVETLNCNSSGSPRGKPDEKGEMQDCYGSVSGIGGGRLTSKEEKQQQSVDCTVDEAAAATAAD
ncbi:Hydroxyproline-rich glycoprotein family protein, putative isoform 2 [Cinnamomum micranthum f. kanehirae]|uniref:Hydroxyproline-rich glycoprotein family protein, putative isoform 2 n=1 Tax=Cinnamomum micranthum f. kanehirae TaxID=337451 RepID=A0A443PYX5_9MAGN|nr:Hydroxyproline-rich glycoprotein family protein, putative isoform 2 [Cinnamomum micranthum f. kanehirae]